MVVERFFQIEKTESLPRDLAFKNRIILVNQEFWNVFRTEVLALTGDSGPLLLYQLGQSIGFRLGAQMKDYAKGSAVKGLNIAFEYGYQAGWGTFKFGLTEVSNGRLDVAEVKLYDNFFVLGRSKTKNPSCFYVAGKLAGLAEGLFDEGHNCQESKCMACGDEYCEFRIARTNPT